MNQCWPNSLMHICGTRGRWVNCVWFIFLISIIYCSPGMSHSYGRSSLVSRADWTSIPTTTTSWSHEERQREMEMFLYFRHLSQKNSQWTTHIRWGWGMVFFSVHSWCIFRFFIVITFHLFSPRRSVNNTSDSGGMNWKHILDHQDRVQVLFKTKGNNHFSID